MPDFIIKVTEKNNVIENVFGFLQSFFLLEFPFTDLAIFYRDKNKNGAVNVIFLLNHRVFAREIILGYTKTIGELSSVQKGLKMSTLAATRSKLVRRWIGFNGLIAISSRISKPKRSSL